LTATVASVQLVVSPVAAAALPPAGAAADAATEATAADAAADGVAAEVVGDAAAVVATAGLVAAALALAVLEPPPQPLRQTAPPAIGINHTMVVSLRIKAASRGDASKGCSLSFVSA
jgi:hypothetical protein